MNKQDHILTDDEILSNLRHEIEMASITDRLNNIFKPGEWEKLKEEMVLQNSCEKEDSSIEREVTFYRKLSEPTRRRVPCAWWGWSVKLYRYYKQEREDIEIIAGGILGLIGFIVIIVLINCL